MKKVTLGSVSLMFTDGDWIESKDQSPTGIRLIQTGNVGIGEFKDRAEKARFISPQTFHRLRCEEVKEGDCLISRLPDPVGRSCIIPFTNEQLITAVDCTIVRFDKSKVIPDYFRYYSQTVEYLADVESACTGATRKRISRNRLGGIELPLSPLPEQRRIVAILDEAFEGIDTAIANAEKNLVNARELFESYLNFVLNFDDDRIPARELATLCEQSRVITYGVIKLAEEIPGGVPCLRTSNVRWLKFETDGVKCIAPSLSNDYKRTILQGGEVLVNVRGTLGGVAAVDSTMVGWNVSREVAVVPSDENKINQSYLAYWIARKASQSWLTDVQKGVAYTGINIADLRQLPVAVPDRKTQVHLVKQLHEFSQTSRRLEAVYQQKLLELAELKQSLLQKAFAGQLTANSLEAAQPKAAE